MLLINLLLMPAMMAKIDALIMLGNKLHAAFSHSECDKFHMEKGIFCFRLVRDFNFNQIK